MSINICELPEAMRKQVLKQIREQDARKAQKETKERIATGGSAALAMTEKKENKLHAEKTDGYASKHEAKRAWELKMLQRSGKIQNLREQVKFVLVPAIWEEIPQTGKRGKPIKPKRKCVQRELAYWADFVYEKDGQTIVEDAKGYKGGATYRIFVNKKKLMLEKYGIEVREV